MGPYFLPVIYLLTPMLCHSYTRTQRTNICSNTNTSKQNKPNNSILRDYFVSRRLSTHINPIWYLRIALFRSKPAYQGKHDACMQINKRQLTSRKEFSKLFLTAPWHESKVFVISGSVNVLLPSNPGGYHVCFCRFQLLTSIHYNSSCVDFMYSHICY